MEASVSKKSRRQRIHEYIAETLQSVPLNPPVVIKQGKREFWFWVDKDGLWVVADPDYKGVEANFQTFENLIARFKDVAKEEV